MGRKGERTCFKYFSFESECAFAHAKKGEKMAQMSENNAN